MEEEGPFSRLELLVGAEGVARLAAARVAVLGLGGVGSACVEALARGGVGHLVLVDADSVEPSNLNRQAVAWASTVGRRKTEVACELVHAVNPQAEVATIDAFLLPENLEETLLPCRGVDFVVDAIDTVAAKLAVAELCERWGIPLVSSMGAARRLDPSRLRFADVYDTAGCPLCRVMRRECRKRGIGALRVLYSDEAPFEAGAGSEAVLAGPAAHGAGASSVDAGGAARLEQAPRSKAPLGTASWLPPIMGEMIAGDVICALLDLPRAGERA